MGVILHPSWVACQVCGDLEFTASRCCPNSIHQSYPRPVLVKIPWDWEPILEAAYRLGGIEAARIAAATLHR